MKKNLFITFLILCISCKEKNKVNDNVEQIKNNELSGYYNAEKYPLLDEAIGLKEDKFFEEAIIKFDEAESEYGPLTSIYLNRGVTYFQIGYTDKSISDFNKCLSLDSEHYAALTNRGIAYVYKEQYSKSVKDLTKAIKLNPKEPVSYLNRAIAFYNLDKTELACSDLKKSKELGLTKKYGSAGIPLTLKLSCLF